jgi:two-component system, NarL family, response regulator NreC
MEMDEIRLMLVDDHDVVRTGLKSFLEAQPGMKVVGQAGSGEEALAYAPEVKPDVVVMDITMPNMDGLEATRQLKLICPDCRVLALTVHEDRQYFFEMLAAGASGYITKQAAADELVSAIRTVALGNVYLQPVLARWLLDDYRRLSDHAPQEGQSAEEEASGLRTKDSLSKRERQVLELVAEGFTTPQISEKLGISPKTVARHRERIMNKLNMHSSTELVRYAIKTGLIHL